MELMIDALLLYAKNGQREGISIEVIIRKYYCKLKSLFKTLIMSTHVHKNIIPDGCTSLNYSCLLFSKLRYFFCFVDAFSLAFHSIWKCCVLCDMSTIEVMKELNKHQYRGWW
jgi:hypothetical protein